MILVSTEIAYKWVETLSDSHIDARCLMSSNFYGEKFEALIYEANFFDLYWETDEVLMAGEDIERFYIIPQYKKTKTKSGKGGKWRNGGIAISTSLEEAFEFAMSFLHDDTRSKYELHYDEWDKELDKIKAKYWINKG